ncbi:SDR family NAD(P)-dependent oxidoreductase [Enterocloster clostridioformis]
MDILNNNGIGTKPEDCEALYTLPDGTVIQCNNKYETDFLYHELYQNNVYLQHGISIKPGDCIFDVGANIGLFSLFVLKNYTDVSIYAFEPSKQLCEKIAFNTGEYQNNITILPYGLSDENRKAVFTFYPDYSILSGFKADFDEDLKTLKSGASGSEQFKNADSEFEKQMVDTIAAKKLEQKTEEYCELKTLSKVIKEQGIVQIDLLKIDAEKCEIDILKGIEDPDWEKIKQLVMELHDSEEADFINDLLTQHGFQVTMVQEEDLKSTNIVNVYAEKKQSVETAGARTIQISGNFTTEPVLEGLNFWKEKLDIAVQAKCCGYNQVFQDLLNRDGPLLLNQDGTNVILIKLDEWVNGTDNLDKINDFIRALNTYHDNCPINTFLVLCPSASEKELCRQAEEMIVTAVKQLKTVSLINARDYHEDYQVINVFDPVSNEIGHIPYTFSYYHFLATLIFRRIYTACIKPIKVIAVDCDNTLWNGICSEDGAEHVNVTGAAKQLQEYLKKQIKLGFLVVLCSKNNEEDVWKVFDNRPDMVLKRSDITDYEINWNPKSENITALSRRLNLGLDSFLFLDDSPLECAEVKTSCPEVLTEVWDPLVDAASFFVHNWYLDHFEVTEGDQIRQQFYQDNAQREKLRKTSYSFQEFLEELNLQVKTEPLAETNRSRIHQLCMRTNQFNFNTNRYSIEQLTALMTDEQAATFCVSASDRFGDYGLIGFAAVRTLPDFEVIDFLLSCRAMGRGIENQIMKQIAGLAAQLQSESVFIHFSDSGKNAPAHDFLEKIGSSCRTDGGYRFSSGQLLALCDHYQEQEMVHSEVKPAVKSAVITADYLNSREQMLEQLFLRLCTAEKISREIEKSRLRTNMTMEMPQADGSAVQSADYQDCIKAAFSKALGYSIKQLDENAEINQYLQADSLKIVEITSILHQTYPNIRPTILFEFRTIKEIENYIKSTDTVGSSVKEMRIEPGCIDDHADTDIAIVGINGRFPGADDIDTFWSNLEKGICSIDEISPQRWNLERYFDSRGGVGKTYSKWGGFFKEVDRFEASFFQISPKEAETMDPQQRIMLELVWGLLEDAGYTPQNADRNTGVFLGMIASDYASLTDQNILQGGEGYRNADHYQVPNRISYFFDFHGPSIAVDTACSSSGTAIHLACNSLINGETTTAVAGGINLFLHPGRYIQYSQMQVLSPDGCCRPFGDGAKGTVYGEGAAVILLKTYQKAIADKDHIYAVIKGSGVNSGGKTNGFTVPNPVYQGQLISDVLKKNHIDSRSITYVETHGTGTALGDPIEIQGLADGFSANNSAWKERRQECAIGSLKANIGHLESCAAVASIIKVVLQMKYGYLVPSLNSKVLNPYILFKDTPFVVQQQLKEWNRLPADDRGRLSLPRRAAVSSFGAGGVNAHFILEEYTGNTDVKDENIQTDYLFIFSSTEECKLERYLRRFIKWIDAHPADPGQIAYTLQIGRTALQKRLAVVAKSTAELISKLNCVLDGVTGISGVFTDDGNKGTSQPDARFIQNMMAEKNLEALGSLWVNGAKIDWAVLYPDWHDQKIPLPGYEFTGSRYWISTAVPEASVIHPMLDVNISPISGLCFKKSLYPYEEFFRDHIINGSTILPGMSFFEFIRAALMTSVKLQPQIEYHNIVWIHPLIVSDKRDVYLKLTPKGENDHLLEGLLFDPQDHTEYAKCKISWTGEAVPVTAARDISGLRQNHSGVVLKDECYRILSTSGYEYGASYQVIEQLSYNSQQVMAALCLNTAVQKDILLQPALLDGALQAVTVWDAKVNGIRKYPRVPYTVRQVSVFRPLPSRCYAIATRSADGQDLEKYDLELVDEAGRMLVSIREYYPRELYQQKSSDHSDKMLVSTILKQKELPYAQIVPESKNYLVFDLDETFTALLKNKYRNLNIVLVLPGSQFSEKDSCCYQINPDHPTDYDLLVNALEMQNFEPEVVLHFWSGKYHRLASELLGDQLSFSVYSVLSLCQKLSIKTEPKDVRFLYFYGSDEDGGQPQYSAVAGMLKTILREQNRMSFKTIDCGLQYEDQQKRLAILSAELTGVPELNLSEVFYKKGVRYQKEILLQPFIPLTEVKKIHGSADRMVVLITGGSGRLGWLFAEYFAKKQPTTIILTGRTEFSDSIRERIVKLKALGSEAVYISADISSPTETARLIADVKERYQKINGVIHAAGIIKDALLINKRLDDFKSVIGPKIMGTICLDQALSKEELDFFVLFSSTSSLAGHLGQCDYSYANRFLDDFALYREQLCRNGERYGNTISINWPWWEDGGMGLNEASVNRLKKQYGFSGMSNQTGFSLFEYALTSDETNIGLFIADASLLQRYLTGNSPLKEESVSSGSGSSDIQMCLINDISSMISTILKLPPEQIDEQINFSQFGFDSITFTQLADCLNKKYHIDLSPADFYEYKNLKQLSMFLWDEHSQNLISFYEDYESCQSQQEPDSYSGYDDFVTAGPMAESKKNYAAVIGIGCIFPGSKNPEEFWNHLKNGDSMITAVPAERLNQYRPQWGGFLTDVDKFDAEFFGISPREAAYMDPQQRILLETVWSTLEDAGCNPDDLAGSKTGVFIGASLKDYDELIIQSKIEADPFMAGGVNNSILANRISYVLDLHGPSEVIDTACSSSLVAIKHAAASIESGESELAIAGGINIILTPKFHQIFEKTGMLSSSGKCSTFDQQADGYVRSEGVGVLLLKPLSRAVQDRDQIYGVIKSVVENHGGRAQSLTAPNPTAQAQLIKDAYTLSQISVNSIDYLETHGTGTRLGDPIEINGLKESFRALTADAAQPAVKTPWCGIGSVKTNIGHLEAASGAAGVIKVLLSMKHEVIPASIHFKQLNSHIHLEGSPFYIVDQPRLWPHKDNIPRRSGVSSFGFGGTNVHLILEDYIPEDMDTGYLSGEKPQLFVISAKDKERLIESAKQIYSYLNRRFQDKQQDAGVFSEFTLENIAYTLQTGRKAMEKKAAFIAGSREELLAALKKLSSGEDCCGLYDNKIKENEPFSEPDSEWKIKLQQYAARWLEGNQVSWNELHQGSAAKKISLPAYPFKKIRHWLPQQAEVIADRSFTGEEFYLTGHIIHNHKVMPGVMYIETALQTAKTAYGKKYNVIRNIIWSQMLSSSDQSFKIRTVLKEQSGQITYKILKDQHLSQNLLCCQGILSAETLNQPAVNRKSDLDRMTGSGFDQVNKEVFYNAFEIDGTGYFGGMRPVERMWHKGPEALSLIRLPEKIRDTFDAYLLHPSIMDGALQTAFGLIDGRTWSAKAPYLPFTVREIRVYQSFSSECYVYARLCDDRPGNGQDYFVCDIVITDPDGFILAEIDEYCARSLNFSDNISSMKVSLESAGVISCTRKWKQAKLDMETESPSDTEAQQSLLMVSSRPEYWHASGIFDNGSRRWKTVDIIADLKDLKVQETALPDVVIYDFIAPPKEPQKLNFQWPILFARTVFSVTRELLLNRPIKTITNIILCPLEESLSFCAMLEEAAVSALNGFARSVEWEKSNFYFKSVKISRQVSRGKLEEILLKELPLMDYCEIKYENELRFANLTEPVESFKENELVQTGGFRNNGTYLIAGGMGGVGKTVATYLARNYQASLILIGRSPEGPEQKQFLARLGQYGGRGIYIQGNLASAADMKKIKDLINQNGFQINGILNCAGNLSDQQLIYMETASCAEVIDPKIQGTINLDLMSQEMDLDFFLMFSSVSAISGNAGQTGYAFANRFLDEFSVIRERLRAAGKRSGKTIALGSPYWKDGGMAMPETAIKWLARDGGLLPAENELCLSMLEHAVVSNEHYIGFLYGYKDKLLNWLEHAVKQKSKDRLSVFDNSTGTADTQWQAQFQMEFYQMITRLLQLPEGKLKPTDYFDQIGMNSLLFMEFSDEIHERFKLDVLPSAFFEFNSPEDAAAYLLKKYSYELQQWYQNKIICSEPAPVPCDSQPEDVFTGSHQTQPHNQNIQKIAVVGMAGVFPGSSTVDEFWDNISEGVDCITELPAGRIKDFGYQQEADKSLNDICAAKGGYLTHIDHFDATFFGISNKEAKFMDPQQRIFLETVWAAIEDAGYRASDLSGTQTGVYAGVANSDYYDVVLDAQTGMDAYVVTGKEHSILANRVSYLLNLHGPSEALNTACSSSLVAIDHAVRAIREGRCELAIAGGINILSSRSYFVSVSDAGMLSPQGRCRPFDQAADGYVRGEGCGVLILKNLEQAERDGDQIYGVILGSGVGHSGRTTSLTAPSANSQAELLIRTYREAGMTPASISYLEAHGTGTKLGDPIEIEGVKMACSELCREFNTNTPPVPYIGIGSVKASIGHLESAAGVAGVIKVLLSMKHKTLPPNPQLHTINPYVQSEDSPFYFVKTKQPWIIPENQTKRRAGISSFGFGGTNAHLILEEYDEDTVKQQSNASNEPQLFVLSAKNKDRVIQYAAAIRAFISNQSSGIRFDDMIFTLQTGREAMASRFACVVNDFDQLMMKLDYFCNEGKPDGDSLFNDSCESVKKTINSSRLREMKPMEIARLWIDGFDIPWSKMPAASGRKKIHLPTYPFSPIRYWLEKRSNAEVPAKSMNEAVLNRAHYYYPVWKQTKIQGMLDQYYEPGCTLVIGSDEDCLKISDLIHKRNPDARIIQAAAGQKFNEYSPGNYLINHHMEADWNCLFDQLELKGYLPEQVIYLCDLARMPGAEDSSQRLRPLLYMCRNLMIRNQSGTIKLIYAYQWDDSPECCLGQAVGAFLKTAALEYPKLQFVTAGISELDEPACQLLLDEVDQTDREVRYLNHQREVKEYCPLPAGQYDQQPLVIMPGGTYLITGGSGGLGQIIAKDLVSRYQINLVIAGRKTAVKENISQIRENAVTGAIIDYYNCDLSDYGQVETLMQKIIDRFGKISGIFHLAGSIRDQFLVKKEESQIDEVLSPKISGVLNLQKSISGRQVDFVVTFSSLAAVTGNIGQGDYSYANAFMDAFSLYQAGQNIKWVSISWPYWLSAGMQIMANQAEQICEAAGLIPLTAEKGLELFYFILAHPASHIIPLYGVSQLIEQSMGNKNRNQLVQQRQADERPISAWLTEMFSDLLDIEADQLDPEISFEEYGVDSIVVNKFNSRIEKRFPNVAKTLLFEYDNIAKLSRFLEQESGQDRAGYNSDEKQTVRESVPAQENNDIAVIGMGGVYPMAETLDEFWENLKQGKDCIDEIPRQRWDWTDKQRNGSLDCHWGGFLSDIDSFDCQFFKISPREAQLMDPQERLFLQVVWETLQDSGYGGTFADREGPFDVGVFAGVTTNTLPYLGIARQQDKSIYPNANFWSIPNRVSFLFRFTGPSLTVDTACSSSLTAVHLACQSIHRGECSMAVAGGVNLYLSPAKYLQMSTAGMLSKTGRCKSFGSGGDGFVPGEGAGAILLKPLSQAIKDHDHIYGVIKGSSLNHGGSTNGLTVPSPASQAEVILHACENARIDPSTISYIEAHGTGTELGDPVEIEGLTRVFRQYTSERQFCSVGSLKSNIGHLEAAAGIAGITKVLLQMKHRMLVPSLHSEVLNPNIAFAETPFYIQKESAFWKNKMAPIPRRAGISSFGAGGTNVHIVLEEYEKIKNTGNVIGDSKSLIILSAYDQNELKNYAARLASSIRMSDEPPSLAEIAYTLQTGRSSLKCRCAFVVDSAAVLLEYLDNISREGEQAPEVYHGFVKQSRLRKPVSYPEDRNGDQEHVSPDLQEIAKLWVAGAEVSWPALYGAGTPMKISLPFPSMNTKKFPLKQLYGITEQSNTDIEVKILDTYYKTEQQTIRNELITTLKKAVAEVLYLESDEIDEDTQFIDLGLDSILGVELVSIINKQLKLSVKATKLYEFTTISEFSDFLAGMIHKTEPPVNEPECQPKTPDVVPVRQAQTLAFKTKAPASSAQKKDDQLVNETDDVAVVGISVRLPGVNDIWEFWNLLEKGGTTITEIPENRWIIEPEDPQAESGRQQKRSRHGGFLNDVDKFEPEFFGISPWEAAQMDPQHRIVLQEVWRALENAGYPPESLSQKRCGIYLGAGSINEYNSRYMFNASSLLSARAAYFLNLKGPVVSIDTACSSSLVALHMASQSLLNKETDMMITGGISLYLNSNIYNQLDAAQMISPDGVCRSFDEAANGFVPSEGCVVLILKRYQDAVNDGDYIYAAIKSSAINQDGHTNGITAPSGAAQRELLIDVYKKGNIDPATITYAEAHGTGTSLGDPIEFDALSEAFRTFTDQQSFCALGSVKTNIGHTSAASGAAGVVKVILSMMNKKIPPLLNFKTPNHLIDLDNSPFYINDKLITWGDGRTPLRACVSSFGFSGTNAHMVLESAEKNFAGQRETESQQPYYLIPLSAKTQQSLAGFCTDFVHWIKQDQADTRLSDISYTLFNGRQHFDVRKALIVKDKQDLIRQLEQLTIGNQQEPADSYYKSGQFLTMLKEFGTSIMEQVNYSTVKSDAEYHTRLMTLAELYMTGIDLDWEQLFEKGMVRKVPLPMYHFEGKSYWLKDAVKGPLVKESAQAAEIRTVPVKEKETKMTSEQALKLLSGIFQEKATGNV